MLYLLWNCIAVHMGAVLWSMLLHAVLHSTQPLQPFQPRGLSQNISKSSAFNTESSRIKRVAIPICIFLHTNASSKIEPHWSYFVYLTYFCHSGSKLATSWACLICYKKLPDLSYSTTTTPKSGLQDRASRTIFAFLGTSSTHISNCYNRSKYQA